MFAWSIFSGLLFSFFFFLSSCFLFFLFFFLFFDDFSLSLNFFETNLLVLLFSIFVVVFFLFPVFVFFVVNSKKSRGVLIFDLSIVYFLKVLLSCVFFVIFVFNRPFFLVFEYDRFRIVRLLDVDSLENGLRFSDKFRRSFQPVALRKMSPNEYFDYTVAALNGFPLSFRTALWIPYRENFGGLKSSCADADVLFSNNSEFNAIAEKFSKIEFLQNVDFCWLPLVFQNRFFTIFLSTEDFRVLGYLPIDPY